MDSQNCDSYNSELIRLCEELEENEELCKIAEIVSQLHRQASSQTGCGLKRTAAALETEEVPVKKCRPASPQPGTSTSSDPAPPENYKHVLFGYGERKIILAEPGTTVPVNSHVTVTGWGKDVSKSLENNIIKSDMQVIERDECDETYPKIVFPSIFCAKFDLANRLSDNGGAAVHNGLIVGISSYGANLEEPPHIALFTNVSYFYKWIKFNTERLLVKHCSKELAESNSALVDY